MGIHLKILHDELPSLRVVVTGSSSFDLATELGEPMTGRKRVYTLFPLSQEEMGSMYNPFELKEHLGEFLVFGSYPEVPIHELSQSLKMNHETVESYIGLFEKAFVLFRLGGFSRNLRNEHRISLRHAKPARWGFIGEQNK